MSLHQNIWELKSNLLHRQKRRAQIIKKYIQKRKINWVLDIGSSEGYATSFMSETSPFVIGVELNLETLEIAKNRVRKASFVNASIQHLPLRSDSFDAVCILEVLEHLPKDLQHIGLREADRVLRSNGLLLISVPYREQIVYTRCIHCNKQTPLWGHLHRLDEEEMSFLLPQHYDLETKYHLPNLAMISCSKIFESLPLTLWILINDLLGVFVKGYWIILSYTKSKDTGNA